MTEPLPVESWDGAGRGAWIGRLQLDLTGVLSTVGMTLVVMGLVQLLPALAGLYWNDPALWNGDPDEVWWHDAWWLAVGAAGTCAAGVALLPMRRRRRTWTRRESLAIVAFSWIAATAAAGVPYLMLTDCGIPNALVESASGLTTTGATVFPDVDHIRPPLHLWRSLTHWLGGAGIVLVVLVLTPFVSEGDQLRRSQRAEASFFTENYRGSSKTSIKGLFTVYLGATGLLFVLLCALGMSAWDALQHAFATISTGGFSTRTASLGAWGPAIQLTVFVFMIVGALNFVVLGRVVEKLRWDYRTARHEGQGARSAWLRVVRNAIPTFVQSLWGSGEVRGYLIMIAAASLVMAGILTVHGTLSGSDALVHATVTVGAISTTTGFCTENYAQWPAGCQVILLMLMVIGGCSGSTAGGLKFGRVLILVKAAYREIRLLPRPQAVIPIRVGGVPVSQAQVQEAARYVVTYLGLLMFVGLLVSMTGEAADDPVSALMLSVSSFGSIGPGYGACDPSGSFLPYAGSAKILAVVAMLLGRLEIFPPLTIVLPSFWLQRSRRVLGLRRRSKE
ncbi:MAG: TrkH family potassium uptake protein [Planctomycetes bacterium]|nr:TrkH family potassium uptake protein [Planctomycetota bacterium]